MVERSVTVYVSSTAVDLEDERQAVMKWLVRARCQAVDSYLPDSDTVRESCLGDIRDCHLYVLILGHRYGFQPTDGNPDGLSITHLEFREAGRLGIPRIALLRTSIPDQRLSDIDDPERYPLVKAFRAEVARTVRAAEFADESGLIQGLSTGYLALGTIRPDGWVAVQAGSLHRQLVDHMTGFAPTSDTRAGELSLDILVTGDGVESRPLAELVDGTAAPILVTGEGGAGKTTSLLDIAARAATRAVTDRAAPVAVYVNLARLTAVDDIADLQRLIVDSVPAATTWEEFLDAVGQRRMIYLFDALNEIPEALQRTCVSVIKRFTGKYQEGNAILVGSRPSPATAQLTTGSPRWQEYRILRLRPDQVQEFLDGLGLRSLHDRMPDELRELGGNPFMLSMIARTLADAASGDLPRNRGRLYEQFVRGWMRRERERRETTYHDERVKQPLLAHLAMRMTAAGRTTAERDDELDRDVEKQLTDLDHRLRRRGGLPDRWTVDGCLTEIVDDGLLRQRGTELQFLHQSVQEYFTGLHLRSDPVALAEFTPRLIPAEVGASERPGLPTHRLVPVLLTVAGLLDDATPVVTAVAERHPVLAAAVIAQADRVSGTAVAQLTRAWLDRLDDADPLSRSIACACLGRMGRATPEIARRLVATAGLPDVDGRWPAYDALREIEPPDVVAVAAVEHVLATPDGDDSWYLVRELLMEPPLVTPVLRAALARRSSVPSEDGRDRLARLAAAVDEPERTSALLAATDAADQAARADVEAFLAEASAAAGRYADRSHRIFEEDRRRFEDRVAEAATTLATATDDEVAAAVADAEPARSAPAVRVAIERGLDVAAQLVESVLVHPRSSAEAVTALLGLLGPDETVAALLERSREPERLIGALQLSPADLSSVDGLSDHAHREIQRLRPDLAGCAAEPHRADAAGQVWRLSPPWTLKGTDRSQWYEIRPTVGGAELWDGNLRVRAIAAICHIDSDGANAALRSAVDDADLRVAAFAVNELAYRSDPALPSLLLPILGRASVAADLVDSALDAFVMVPGRDALGLLEHLLAMPVDLDGFDVHPRWESGEWSGDVIHDALVALDADADVRAALDAALDGTDPIARAAALREYGRWFTSTEPASDRLDEWLAPALLSRVFDLVVDDPDDTVRRAAADALNVAPPDLTRPLLDAAFASDDPRTRVAAAAVLAATEDPDLQARLATAVHAVATGRAELDLRRRAGALLAEIPGGVERLHGPIQAALDRDEPQRARDLVQAALEIRPDDVDLNWWLGHALRRLGQFREAADRFERAAALDESIAVIPLALAETLLDLGDIDRATQAARRSIELDRTDAGAFATLAWCLYEAGAIEECVVAAGDALDRDPIDLTAMWVLVLGHLQGPDPSVSLAAVDHARRAAELLLVAPGTEFAETILGKIDQLDLGDDAAAVCADVRALLEPVRR